MIKPSGSSHLAGIRTSAILIGSIAALYLARQILIPLALAITLALILAPAVAWLQKARLGRTPAVLAVMVVSIAAAGAISFVIFNELVDAVTFLADADPEYHLAAV